MLIPQMMMSWPTASTVFPMILPMSNCRAGTPVSRISTILDCFSSTTELAIITP